MPGVVNDGSAPYVLRGPHHDPEFDYHRNPHGTNEVVWRQRFTVPQHWAVYGIVSLAGYPEAVKSTAIIRFSRGTTPILCVRLPFSSADAKSIPGAALRVNLRGANLNYAFEGGQWKDRDRIGVLESGNCLLLRVDQGTAQDWSRVCAGVALTIPLNAGIGSPNCLLLPSGSSKEIIVDADTNGVIDFAGRGWPLRSLTLDARELPWGLGKLQRGKFRFGASGGELLHARPIRQAPIGFPTFNEYNCRPVAILYGGELDGIEGEVVYHDAFSGTNKEHLWRATSTLIQAITRGSGNLTLTLGTIGLRQLEISFADLIDDLEFDGGKVQSLSMTLTSDDGLRRSLQAPLESTADRPLRLISERSITAMRILAVFEGNSRVDDLEMEPDQIALLNVTVGPAQLSLGMFTNRSPKAVDEK